MIRAASVFQVTLLSGLLLSSGCSIYSVPGQDPAPIDPPPDYTEVTPPSGPSAPPPGVTLPDMSPRENAEAAYGPLLARAETATDKGDYEQALMLLERAQRIDPDSAEIYLALAQTHSARGDRKQAQSAAERGLLYCAGTTQCAALRVYVRR